jgi:hypothetical protein
MDMNGPPKLQRSPQAMLQRLEKTDVELHRILSDVRIRSAWDDTFVDALCEPAETFTFGGVFAHVMTFNAHRRLMPWTLCANSAFKPKASAILWSTRKVWLPGASRKFSKPSESQWGHGEVPTSRESTERTNCTLRRQKSVDTMKTGLLRFNGAVQRAPTIDAWLKQYAGELGAIAHQWFDVMRKCGDEVRELFHDGCPVACLGDAPFDYVNVFTSHVNVGSFHGASLPDPARLLQGTGKFMRQLKMRPGTDTNTAALIGLIDAAYSDIKARIENG